MKTFGALGGLAAVLVFAVVGCGEEDPKQAPTGKAGSGGSAGTAGDRANGGADDAAGTANGGSSAGSTTTGGTFSNAAGTAGAGGSSGGAGGGAGDGGTGGTSPLTFQSKPAGIELELDAATKASGLTLSTTSITQETTGSLNYVEWLGELVNGSSQTQCLIAVTGDFQTASGSSVIKLDTFAQGAAYDLGLSVTSPCVAPGGRVPLWTNDLPDLAIKVDTIAKLVVTIEPITSPDAVLHPSTPTLAPVTKTYSATFEAWQIASTATATADIYNVSITFWGKTGGFFVDSEKDFHLENFLAGQTWAIDTAPLGLETETLVEVIPYFSFIDGLKPGAALRRVYDEQTSALLERRDAVQTTWDDARARQLRALSAR